VPDAKYARCAPRSGSRQDLLTGQLSAPIREERSMHLLRLDKRWMDPKTNK